MKVYNVTSVFDKYGVNPIYSPEKRRIFKNQSVAECNDVTGGQTWNVVISCSSRLGITGMSEVFLQPDVFDANCDADFEFPGDISEIATQRCYKDLITDCSLQDDIYERLIPPYLHMNTVEIRDACRNGPMSPVFASTTFYKNIFCAVCSRFVSVPFTACSANKTSERSPVSGEISFLISMDSVTDRSRSVATGSARNMQMACLINDHQVKLNIKSTVVNPV